MKLTQRFIMTALAMLALLAAMPSTATAFDTRAELKARFEQRYPQLNKLKAAGSVGETAAGYVDPIDDVLLDEAGANLVKAENADRRKLYDLIADEVTPSGKIPAAVVAQRNAKRNFEKAGADEYLRLDAGYWIQKKDAGRSAKVERLKKEGKVGESASGYLEAVTEAHAMDSQVKDIISQERQSRQLLYERIAKARKSGSADAVAREWGEEILKHVAPGEFYRTSDGRWLQKPQPPK